MSERSNPHIGARDTDANPPLVQDRHLVVRADEEKPLSTRARRRLGNVAVVAAVGAVGLIGAPMLMHADNPAATAPATSVSTTDAGSGLAVDR